MNKTDYLWKFALFDIKKKDYRIEILNGYHSITAQVIASWIGDRDKIVEVHRDAHRRAIGEKVTEAIYEGWMPFDIEWWEGEYDDKWVLKDYYPGFSGPGDYHFYTRIYLATRYAFPMLKRNIVSPWETTIEAYSPRSLNV